MQKQLKENGRIEDFKGLLEKYILEAICAISLGIRMNVLHNKVNSFSLSREDDGEGLMKYANVVFECVARTQWGPQLFKNFRTPIYRKFLRASDEMNRIIRQKMTEASAVEDFNVAVEKTSLAIRLREAGLSETQVEAVVGEFLQAGIVATSGSLSLLLYNLARNQECQAELLKTVEPLHFQVMKSDLQSGSYLGACMKESFRHFAPVPGTFRITTESMQHNGYHIPANSGIFFNNQVMSKMEQFVTEPEEFKPERYLMRKSEDSPISDKYTKPEGFVSVPFGHGARTCIGKRFAETLMSVATLKIIQNFHVTYNSDAPPRIESKIFTVPVGNLPFGFTPRDAAKKI